MGIELLEALIPDPLDALELMVDFAGSYAQAREAIRDRNRLNGFAIGWAAYLVIPRWGWAKWFAYTSISRNVVTEVLGAAGVAENAFNDGLVRGFIYGEKHTTAQSDKLRQMAFDAVLGRVTPPAHLQLAEEKVAEAMGLMRALGATKIEVQADFSE
jgi:hypothetical protein